MTNLQKYNLITADKIGGGFRVKSTKTKLQILHNECGISNKIFEIESSMFHPESKNLPYVEIE